MEILNTIGEFMDKIKDTTAWKVFACVGLVCGVIYYFIDKYEHH